MNCACSFWARDYGSYTMMPHHRNCDNYSAADEVAELEDSLGRVLKQIREAERQRDCYREALRAECGDVVADRWQKEIEGSRNEK